MTTDQIVTELQFDEQFLTFFACLNVFLQNDSKLDTREKAFLLKLASSMGLNWLDASALESLVQKKALSTYHAVLLNFSQREREHLLRALIAIMNADKKNTSEEIDHLQEVMSYLGLKKWDLKEFGEKIRVIKIEDVDLQDFTAKNQPVAYLALLEFSCADRNIHSDEQARIEKVFPQMSLASFPIESRKMALAILVERILFGKGLWSLPLPTLQKIAATLKAGIPEKEVSTLLVSVFNYQGLVQPSFENVLFDRIDEVQDVLQLSEATTTALLDFFAAMLVVKKDDTRTSPLVAAMRACFVSKTVSAVDRQELWKMLDTKLGFAKLPIKVKNEALAVVLSAVALDGLSKQGEEIALDEIIELFGCDKSFVQNLVTQFNKSHGVRIVLPEKMNLKDMKAEVKRKNREYDGMAARQRVRDFAKSWEHFLKESEG